MSYPNDRSYASSHEWAMLKDGLVYVGITAHAQESLGDIVHVELPKVGDIVKAGKTAGEIESVKSASDIYSPVSGEVVDVNAELDSTPELVNKGAHNEGWMFAVKPSDLGEFAKLLDANAYAATL